MNKSRHTSLEEISRFLGEPCYGDSETAITGIASVTDSCSGDITFVAGRKFWPFLADSQASAVIISPELVKQEKLSLDIPYIVSENPYLSFARLLEFFHPPRKFASGVHPSAVIEDGVEIQGEVSIGPHVYIETGTKIEAGVILEFGTHIGPDCQIGNLSHLASNVVLRERVTVGSDCIIHSGTVIGSDGYGFVKLGQTHAKIPQVGTVVIGNSVEIGANVTIDRATCGVTSIGNGTKIDNLVHIAHNVSIGENCLIVAQVGVSGSVEIGSNVTLAGQVGVVGHIKIGDNTTVAARSVATNDIEPGSFVSGFPAHDHKEERRIKVAMKKLPEIVKFINDMKKRLDHDE